MTNPIISVDRSSERIAIFDGDLLARDFESYDHEGNAIKAAEAWVAQRSQVKPNVVYPHIRRMTISTAHRATIYPSRHA